MEHDGDQVAVRRTRPDRRSAHAPALVDVATPVDLRHLDHGPVGASLGGVDSCVDRDLLGVGSVLEASARIRPSRWPPSAMPSRDRMVGVTSTLPTGVRTVVRFLKPAPHAMNVFRTFHGLMLPWSLA